MHAEQYKQLVLDTLQGKTSDLQDIPPERLDWEGSRALLDLYNRTSGKDRLAITQAIGTIIEQHSGPVPVIAELVDIASAFDLAQVEPNVRSLQGKKIAAQEPLRSAIANYLAYRELYAQGHAPPVPLSPDLSSQSGRKTASRKKTTSKPKGRFARISK